MLRDVFVIVFIIAWVLLMIITPVVLFVWAANLGILDFLSGFFFTLWFAAGVSEAYSAYNAGE